MTIHLLLSASSSYSMFIRIATFLNLVCCSNSIRHHVPDPLCEISNAHACMARANKPACPFLFALRIRQRRRMSEGRERERENDPAHLISSHLLANTKTGQRWALCVCCPCWDLSRLHFGDATAAAAAEEMHPRDLTGWWSEQGCHLSPLSLFSPPFSLPPPSPQHVNPCVSSKIGKIRPPHIERSSLLHTLHHPSN